MQLFIHAVSRHFAGLGFIGTKSQTIQSIGLHSAVPVRTAKLVAALVVLTTSAPMLRAAENSDLLTTAETQQIQRSLDEPIRHYKKQAIQKVTVAGGWVGATSGNDLSSSYLETSIGLGVPLGSFDNILGVTPLFRADYVDAAPHLDIPSEMFETGVSLFYRRPFKERLSWMAIVRPSIRSDFSTGDNAFRLFGLGLVNWECQPEKLTLSFGAVFLDRADLPLLPAVGVSWSPQPATKLDLRFPESKLSHRIAKDGCHYETWTYLSAGIGGNTWAVTRANGNTDELSLRDIRLVCGIDHVTDGGGGWFAEFGYAFNRRIEYESTQTEVGLSDGVILQGGWRY